MTEALPALLELLDRLALRGTFFVEAINTEHYPEAVREIAARGHEVGFHAWRHERWSELDAEREEQLVERGVEAFASLGVPVEGFRPPGGELTERSLGLLARAGIRWCSPAGDRARLDPATGVAIVPFRWPLVDATYLHPPMGGTLEPAEAERRLWGELESAASGTTLILHPFLAVDAEVRSMHERLLTRLAGLPDVRVVPGRVAADRLR